MKKNICVATATRAEYGLLKPVILGLKKDFNVRVAVTGAHLSEEYGFTYQEIEKDGIEIDIKIDILENGDDSVAVSHSMANAINGFGNYFADSRPDMLVILGDHYEAMAVAIAAMNAGIPIAHIHGGETTQGVIDEAIRHSITKMSYLHFTAAKPYRNRVIQLGEHPSRVFDVGALGVENVKNVSLLTKEGLAKEVGLDLNSPYAVVTYHPVTLEIEDSARQITDLLRACDKNRDMQFICTGANAEAGGHIINDILKEYADNRDNVVFIMSLGIQKYLSALKYAAMVIGNSSSGILEAPSFGIPTVNIGDRQKGRILADSIICCNDNFDDISKAITYARNPVMKNKAKVNVSPYGEGNASKEICRVIKEFLYEEKINLKKEFYDIPIKL